LASQQKQVGALLASQRDQQSQLSASRAQVNALLSAAQQSAGAANSLLKSTNSLLAQKQAQQAALLQASSSTYKGSIPGASGGTGGACANPSDGRNGGYPALWCNAAQDSIQTPSGYNRECVSWSGWRWHQMGGPFINWGNANTWDNYARAAGYTVSSTPTVGSVAQTDRGPFGHVANVEQISGGNVIVSEMNYDNAGHFRYGVYPISYFVYIR
jgi:surface antigen